MAKKEMRFYTTETLGPNRARTPEGFLLCTDVRIARIGIQLYRAEDVDVEASPDGTVKVQRDPEEVFRPETLASFAGKPFVNEHPEADVTPENWRDLAMGIVLNPRRGTGVEDDYMVADILVTDEATAQLIETNRKREISCGYTADYEEIERGLARQTNIIGNHVALVVSGRCGQGCAISDHSDTQQEKVMATKPKQGFVDALMRAFKAKDVGEVEKIAEESHDAVTGEEGGDTHVHVHMGEGGGAGSGEPKGEPTHDEQVDKRLDSLEAGHQKILDTLGEIQKQLGANGGTADAEEEEKRKAADKAAKDEEALIDSMAEEMPEGTTKDAARKMKDSTALEDSFQESVSMAEILVPGIDIPTFDSALKPAKSFKDLCGLRRRALDSAYAADAKEYIDGLTGKSTLDTKTMSCSQVRNIFRATALAKRASNNASAATRTADDGKKNSTVKPIRSAADLNELHRRHYGQK